MYLQGQKEDVRNKIPPVKEHITTMHKIQNLNLTAGLKYLLLNSRLKIVNGKMVIILKYTKSYKRRVKTRRKKQNHWVEATRSQLPI